MLWIFILLVILTFIFNKLTEKYGVEKLYYFRELSKNKVEINEPFQIIFTIENKKLLSVPFLQVLETCPEGLEYDLNSNTSNASKFSYHTFNIFILPYQRIKRTYTLFGRKRGRYIFRSVTLIAEDFIGINSKSKKVEQMQEIIVLPKSLPLKDALIPFGDYNGDISVKRWIIDDPLMIVGLKEYTGIEPQKYIHWNASMKYGKLMVKNFDFTINNTLVVVLNIESNKPFWPNIDGKSIEECISLSRGILEELESKQIPYGFTTNAIISGIDMDKNMIYPGIGSNRLEYLTEILGRIEYSITNEFQIFLQNIINKSNKNETYVIVTPRVFDCYLNQFEILNNKSSKLILISLSEENLDLLNPSIIKYVRRKKCSD